MHPTVHPFCAVFAETAIFVVVYQKTPLMHFFAEKVDAIKKRFYFALRI
jgi:hypothetical protein